MRPDSVAVPAGDARDASRRMRRAYEEFVSSRQVPPFVRRVIADSWRRCAEAGAAPPDHLPLLRLSVDEVRAQRGGHPLAPLLPMITDLLGGSAGDGHIFGITDAGGTLLWVRGDAEVLRGVERMNFVEGAGWAESQAGTNAPGTALAIGQPVQIVTAEHLNSAVQAWSCAAAPVRDPDSGRVLGVLDLTGGADIAHPQALALVRATARVAEAELARRLAAIDERARRKYLRGRPDGEPAVLLSPGGRVLHGPPGLDAVAGLVVAAGLDPAPAGLLPDGRRMLVEPVGDAGHLVVRFVGGPTRDGDPAPRLAALGRDAALLEVDGRRVQLRPRHSEILVVLALAGPGGLPGGRLAVELSEDDLARVTLRAEMSRLRARLGADLLGSMPYRLRRPVRADFLTVRDLVAEGRVADALAMYPGPLLPSSQAPGVVAARVALQRQLRGGVLAAADQRVLRRWVGTAWGSDDARAWRRLADLLPGGSPRRSAAAARARELNA